MCLFKFLLFFQRNKKQGILNHSMNKKDIIRRLEERKHSEKVVDAFQKVDRERFAPGQMRQAAYEDVPLPLFKGATISQPSTIAFMLEILDLEKGHKVLEVGSGCGYVLALLSEITSKKVYGVEVVKELVRFSQENLIGYDAEVYCRDGKEGLPEEAPFDRIIVSAAADKIPDRLVEHLKEGGIMVIPLFNSIVKIKKEKDRIRKKEYHGFRFVPLK